MTKTTAHPPGTFNWVDLATPDAMATKTFYAGLFRWNNREIVVGLGIFTMLHLRGQAVASLYQLSEAQRAQDVPAHWMAYVTVTDVDDTAARASALGGQVIVPAFDVLDLGRMALILDSTGVPLAVWQAGRHVGAGLINQPGGLTWTELITPDVTRAGQFYTRLFGWDIKLEDGGFTFLQEDEMVAGMKPMMIDQDNTLPQWRVYFGVADCEVSVEKARALGGEVIVPPTGRSLLGQTAVIRDDQGALFAIMQPLVGNLCET